MFHNAEEVILIASVILFLSILAGKAGFRFGLPTLLLFLGVGMLFGSDGLGIQFNDLYVAQFIGTVALSVILFSGGMDTKMADIRPVATQGIVLATVGVLATTLLTGGFIYLLIQWIGGGFVHLSFPESLLMASVMSSTDSASVFSILRTRGTYLKESLRPALELESGSNDPMAYILTLLLISYVSQEGGEGTGMWVEPLMMFFVQMTVGAVLGYLFGKASIWLINRIDINNVSFYPILLFAVALFTFAAVTLCKGNGYLAVYLTGLTIGNAKIVHKKSIRTFFDGFTWLFQIVMFLTLGLLVNPSQLLPIAPFGLLVAVFMILVSRPISVFLCLLPFRKFSFPAMSFISWVGLRGAVPIIFAIYPLIAGVDNARMIFNVVFFITIISLLVQGTTVTAAAGWFKVADKPAQKESFAIELPEEIKSAMSEIEITTDVLKHGNKLMEFTLPDHTLAVMVKRRGNYFIPKGNTELHEGDRLLMISDNDEDLLQAYNYLGITDYTLKKN
ncbi:MAG: potassium/proton antiporter [Tannerellaceae bacterium]|jgi:cell volume regulation protein A|nr:potassium/proton antiporter [Tannerellaceae bacterium]